MRGGGSAIAGELDEGERFAPLARGRGERAGHDGARGFLDERIPFAAGVAFAGPFGPDRAAGLAGEDMIWFGHRFLILNGA